MSGQPPARSAGNPSCLPPEAPSEVRAWEIDFAAPKVQELRSADVVEAGAVLSGTEGVHAFAAGQVTDRNSLWQAVQTATSAELVLPWALQFPATAIEGGEFGLRAWTFSLLSGLLTVRGPFAVAPSAAAGGGPHPSAAARELWSPEDIAARSVAAAQTIQDAACHTPSASAAGVLAFISAAMGPARAEYARGGSTRRAIADALTFAGADSHFPWREVQGDSESLAVLYNFAPFQDTGSTVASKRLREFAETFDVISCSFLQHKKVDATVDRISAPYVAAKDFVPLAPSWATWASVRAFAERACLMAGDRIRSGKTYRRLYTRAMWVASLYAGAEIKHRHPELAWTAEFSDPLSLDVEGAQRGGHIPRDGFTRHHVAEFEARYGRLLDDDLTIFRFAELLAFAFADEIIFTNQHQRDIMLDSLADGDLRERARAISTVENHPTLPAGFYELCSSGYVTDPGHVNIGYFGEFYTARGITEISDALRALPDMIRSRVRLHVFTNYIPESSGGVKPASFSTSQFRTLVERTLSGVGAEGLDDVIIFNNSLPFVKFISATQQMDHLIVTDARSGTGHAVNPYLPSKWSDYKGSSSKVWGLTEAGSVLAGMELDVQTSLGDSHAAREALWRMVEAKFPRGVGDDAAHGGDQGGQR